MRRHSVIILFLALVTLMMAGTITPMADDNKPRRSRTAQKNEQLRLDSIAKAKVDSIERAKNDTTQMDSIQKLIFKHNMHIEDSLRRDSINKTKKNGLESPAHYSSDDSMVYIGSSKTAYLYGQSKVKYETMNLESENINMNLDNNLVYATGIYADSTETELEGTPVFTMGQDTYENDTILFNFKTKKGLISNVTTQQEDGYLTSKIAKRNPDGGINLAKGQYTTCDAEHPDFYLALSRAKVRPGKDVVFGPAYLVVADVPLPLAIPYGFFPFTKNYSSGLIMPTYGDETARGFYLRDGGYYFAISDKMDMKLIGEIYTKGSWGVSATSNYKKRYKYSGNLLFSYQDTRNGEKGMPDYNRQESFKVQWSHRQDAKANPYSQLSASVNFATSSYEKNNLSSMYNPQTMTQSTRTSSVAWNTAFSSIGLNLSTTANLSQNMRDSSISMTLPDLNISLSRFYPFKRKHAVGKERWYEKLSMSYTGHISNSYNGKENQIMHSSITRDWKNGMQHSIPIAGSFTLFKYLNVTPSFNLTDRTYFSKVMRSWDEMAQKEVADTTYGFHNVYNWNLSLSLSTKAYMNYIPMKKLLGERFPVERIRHVITPTVSLSYAPDFSASRYGYYDTYQKTDANGNVSLVEYSPYNGMLYGVPGKGKTGSVSFGLSNNVEMKWRNKEDSIVKVSLIDELGFNMSYNMAATTRPLSDLSTRIRLKLSKSYTFNMTANFATYAYTWEEGANGNRTVKLGDRTQWGLGRFGRFQGTSQNISYTFTPEKLRKLFNRETEEDKRNRKRNDEDLEDDEGMDTDVESNVDDEMISAQKGLRNKKTTKAATDDDGYMTFSMPWSFTVGYGITMREDTDQKKFKYTTINGYNTGRYPYKFTQNLNCSGNIRLAEGWNISFSSGYDFANKKISMTTASMTRDLHCFSMSCSMVLAPYTSYNFSFRCNASTLTDVLKYDKRSGVSNSVKWY